MSDTLPNDNKTREHTTYMDILNRYDMDDYIYRADLNIVIALYGIQNTFTDTVTEVFVGLDGSTKCFWCILNDGTIDGFVFN